MYKIDDFTREEIELEENEEVSEEQKLKLSRTTDLYFKLVELEKSQYVDVLDDDFVNKLNTDIYEDIKEAAYLGHGKSEIEFDKDKGVCDITLYVKHLLLNNDFGMYPGNAAKLLKMAVWSKISMEDEFIKLQFMFDINKHVKIADHSKQIEELKYELKNGIK